MTSVVPTRVEVDGLNVQLAGRVVVRDVAFRIPAGDSIGLWGENGAGKTTVIRAILGHVRATGRILVDGLDPRHAGRAVRARIGYVPQQVALYDDLTCAGLLRFVAGLRGADGSQSEALLERVGLGREGAKPVGHLSGGMRQRLALAVSLLGDPPILVLDEPTANLDAAGRAAFLELLADLRTTGLTMLVTTHRHEEVAALADTVVVLEGGAMTEVVAARDWVRRAMAPARLHVMLARHDIEDAIVELAHYGIAASRNGSGINLPIRPSERTGPLAILRRAGIDVEGSQLHPTEIDA